MRLFTKRTLYFPTPLGLLLFSSLFLAPFLLWFFYGESFLSQNHPLPAKILVVESWIGLEGLRAAAEEFSREPYDYLVTTGGLTPNRWTDQPSSYPELAAFELSKLHIPKEKILIAPAHHSPSHRTHFAALATWQTLKNFPPPPPPPQTQSQPQPLIINVFTLGPHARRSCLIYQKSAPPQTRVGIISWSPPQSPPQPWYTTSDRAENFLKESAALLYELLPHPAPPPPSPPHS